MPQCRLKLFRRHHPVKCSNNMPKV
ncbi:DNA polymerase III subunit chi, partial [Neisseria gonorrhoeae]